ncbi:hypothetical protein FRC10_002420 [Ceratobasidium sp. 414]|nr:hypothetical protein FRC10_002420 [Ceratobasidium sp. 414]
MALEQRIMNLANEIMETREEMPRWRSTRTPAAEATAMMIATNDKDRWDNLPMRPTGHQTSFARESTTKLEGVERAKPPAPEVEKEDEPYLNQTTTMGATIPKEAQTKKPDPFNGKKGKEGEAFIVRMEVHFQDYEDGTFNDNWKICATLMNMSTGDTMNWAQPLLCLSAAQEDHEFLESWDSFKKGFLTHFSNPAK